MSFTITPENPCRCDAMEIETRFDQIQIEKEAQLLALPSELIVNILRNLSDFEDKWNFSLTCRRIREIVWDEEKFLKIQQIKLLINCVESYFKEEVVNNLKQVLYDLEQDRSQNFLKTTRKVFKSEFLISDFVGNLKEIKSTEKIFEIVQRFIGKNTPNSTLLHFFQNNPSPPDSLISMMFDTFGGEDEVFKIIRKIKWLITPQDFDAIRLNIIRTLLSRVNENNIKGILEIADDESSCIWLIYPHLKLIIKAHIESEQEENLQRAIELALSFRTNSWMAVFLAPTIVFLSESNDQQRVKKAFDLAYLFTNETIRCACLKTILAILAERDDVENLREVIKLATFEVNRFYEDKEVQKFQ